MNMQQIGKLKKSKSKHHLPPFTLSFPLSSYFLVLSSLLFLSSCTFLYIPPLIESQPFKESLDIENSKGLYLEDDKLFLSVKLNQVPTEGWLMVQWFAQDNTEAASDALWVNQENEGFSSLYVLPANVTLAEGNWRAVLSFNNNFIRQFSLDIQKTE